MSASSSRLGVSGALTISETAGPAAFVSADRVGICAMSWMVLRPAASPCRTLDKGSGCSTGDGVPAVDVHVPSVGGPPCRAGWCCRWVVGGPGSACGCQVSRKVADLADGEDGGDDRSL
jgi:hypothetical protein